MSRTAKAKRRTGFTKTGRALIEAYAVGATGPALTIDRDAGVIYGVKVLGRFSRNSHGLTEAENGTEYSPACMREALPLYEGAKVRINHPTDRTRPGAERDIRDTFGVLRSARIESEDDGIRADLHYRKHHDLTPDVLDDIDRRLGLWGLSHNASAARERVDSGSRRLVIESLAKVRSVDLVDKPATGTNLWESERTHMATTLRELLESRRKGWSKPRKKWCDLLLEDDGAMAPMMDAPAEVEAGGDEDDALWTGFQAAIQKLFDKYRDGSMDEKEVGKQVVEYLKAHKKLTQDDEPEAPSESPAEPAGTDAQESEELVAFRAERAARVLCESLDLKSPTTAQVAAIAGVKDDKLKRELIESFKGKPAPGGGYKAPRSAAPGTVGGAKKKPEARETPESEVVPAAAGMRVLMGD